MEKRKGDLEEALHFKVLDFDGPLDALLKLIQKNKIDIYDIPISELFRQYLQYLEEMQAMNMDIAGEFITMAAELMLIKSRMLLPHDEEDDPRKPLVDALQEYAKTKEIAAFLQKQYVEFCGRMTKDTDEIAADPIDLSEQDLGLLERALERLLRRYEERKNTEHVPEKTFQQLLKRKIIPVPERIYGIMRYLYQYGTTDFEHLMYLSQTRSELLTSFMAVLELVKAQRVLLREEADGVLLLSLSKAHIRDQNATGRTEE